MSAPYPDPQDLHAALLRALAPVTRWHIPHPAEAVPTRINTHGIDHHDSHVGPVHLDPDGRAHAYIATYEDNGLAVRGRTITAGSQMTWGVTLTVAGGDPARARFALRSARSVLDGTVLTDAAGRPLTTGLLEQLGSIPATPDETVNPVRWVTQLRYVATARRPQ